MALEFLKNLFGARRYLGVDIGTASLKIVEVKKSGNSPPELLNYGYLESFDYLARANEAFQTSTLKLQEQMVADYLRALMKQSGIPAAPVIASLPAFSAFTTLIEVPLLTEEELGASMGLHAKQYVPLPVSEVALEWIKVGERTDAEKNRKQQILLVAVPNDIIARYKKIFELAGLPLVALEVETLAMARSLTADAEGPALIMDIGSRSTAFAIAENGALKFAGQTDFSGASLTQTVAMGLHLASRRAEDIKRKRGLSGGAGEYELFTLLQPMVDVIINEGVRVLKNYETGYQSRVGRVILSGGTANLPGFDAYVAKETNLPVARAAPFGAINFPPQMAPVIGDLGPLFSVAVGLGLKIL